MTKQTDLGGSFTLPNTSMTLNRMGYGAMQLASPQLFGPPREMYAAVAVLRAAVAVLRAAVALGREPYRYQRLLRSARYQSNHQAGAPSLSGVRGDRH